MKLYIVSSGYHTEPLAEIRTDGENIEWVVDNTGGRLPKSAPNLQRLKDMCEKSSHMSLEEPANPGIGLLRYVMQNGDIVEITSDGASAMLNGKLLDEQHKNALMTAIANGGVRVAQRADTRNPMPIIRTPKQGKLPQRASAVSEEFINAAQSANKNKQRQESRDNPDHDSRIEAMDFGPSDDTGKSLMYYLKYGVGKGERND